MGIASAPRNSTVKLTEVPSLTSGVEKENVTCPERLVIAMIRSNHPTFEDQ